jgi:hypothetical protein
MGRLCTGLLSQKHENSVIGLLISNHSKPLSWRVHQHHHHHHALFIIIIIIMCITADINIIIRSIIRVTKSFFYRRVIIATDHVIVARQVNK